MWFEALLIQRRGSPASLEKQIFWTGSRPSWLSLLPESVGAWTAALCNWRPYLFVDHALPPQADARILLETHFAKERSKIGVEIGLPCF